MREIKFRAWDKKYKDMITDYLAHSMLHLKHIEPDNYELMQFTGLKDSEGVEIYEGDIVSSGGGRLKEVIFNQGEHKTSFSLKSSTGSLIDIGLNSDSHLKVIGNIYQNPELLK